MSLDRELILRAIRERMLRIYRGDDCEVRPGMTLGHAVGEARLNFRDRRRVPNTAARTIPAVVPKQFHSRRPTVRSDDDSLVGLGYLWPVNPGYERRGEGPTGPQGRTKSALLAVRLF